MIQIDDAGSGSLIGGTCIGIYNTENNNYFFDIIPLCLYNEDNHNKKEYLDYVVSIVKDALKRFKVSKSTVIQVCRGYMFDKLRLWLTNNNYNWESVQIAGALQDLVEDSFSQYAISLGFPYQYIKYTKYPFHFHKILRWVYADFDNRSKLCKTGWNSWKKYGRLEITTTINYLPSDTKYHCLKCGRLLNPKFKVRILTYTSNAPNTIYLHLRCKSRT
jgi:hypothetical protein